MIKKRVKSLLAVIVIVSFLFSQTAFAQGEPTSGQDKDLDYLKSIMEMIEEKYGGNVTDEQLIEGAIRGMFNTMDPYTTYFNTDEADSFLAGMDGTFVGIGVGLQERGGYIAVTKVYASSPAEKAGIYPGDKIVSVDGRDVLGQKTEQVTPMITGKAGTKVELGILRGDGNSLIKIKITRDKITINPVTYEIRNGIGYIRIDMFGTNSSKYFISALNEMDKKKITKLIVDLRNNPGGYVSEAVTIARKLIPRGLITKLDYKSEKMADEVYYSDLNKTKYKLTVLMNENSASASEILAGAVQDTGAGTLIGTKSFGKGKVQTLVPILSPEAYEKYEKDLGIKVVDVSELFTVYSIIPFADDIIGYSKITTGFYYTPKGRMIDGTGLQPDIKIDNYTLESGIDVDSIEALGKTRKPGLNDTGLDIFKAENILKLGGYDVDTPDARLDKKTFEAIKKFQKEMGGYPYGVLDFTTQQWLNERLEELRSKIDKQYAGAVEVLSK